MYNSLAELGGFADKLYRTLTSLIKLYNHYSCSFKSRIYD